MRLKMDIDEKLVEEYERNGAVLVKGVFDQEWVEKMKVAIAKNYENPSQYSERLKAKENEGAYFDDYCNWKNIPELKEFVYSSPAAKLVARFMRASQVSFYHEHILNKEPGTSKITPWHHDQPYYPIDGDKVCSIWMPVDPVPKDTSIQFVAGSHRWPQWFHPRKFGTELNYEMKEGTEGKMSGDRKYYDVPVEDIEKGKWPLLVWECEPGDAILFHMRTVHGAPGNFSLKTHRRIVSTRWLGDDAVLATRPWDVSPPITGGLLPGQRAVSDTFPLVYTQTKPLQTC